MCRHLSLNLAMLMQVMAALVRTLADVFSNQAWMIQHYASYVLHLEKALHEIEEILETANPLVSAKKRMRDKDAAKEQKRLAKTIIVGYLSICVVD